jgi:hypothetical protein
MISKRRDPTDSSSTDESQPMKILFTKSEYRTLFDMIYMAEWMLTAYDTETDPAKAKYHHLAQKIYSHAKEMGCETLVEDENNEYFTTAAYEQKSGIHDLIDTYDSDSFWDQLVDRLTERDVEEKARANAGESAGVSQSKPLSNAAYSALADPIADAYEREFSAHGLDRLYVKGA